MNNLLRLGAALAVAVAANSLSAQDPSGAGDTGAAAAQGADGQSAPAPKIGLLGQTYISLDAGFERFQDIASSPDAFTSGLGINLPMTDNFDYSLNYGLDFGRDHGFRLTDSALGNSVTTFYRFAHVAPFLRAGIDYDWERIESDITPISLPSRFDRLDYDMGAGLEFPLSDSASLRTGIGVDNGSLRIPHARNWDYELSANYWLGSVVGAFIGADLKDGRGGAPSATGFTFGLRFLLGSG